jgi:hypothetical protein
MIRKLKIKHRHFNRDVISRIDPNIFSRSSISGGGYFLGNTNLAVRQRFMRRHSLSETNILHAILNLHI